MEKELVSVIIPVYNVEKYIDECLNSIIEQSYKNMEIIVLNDGSTDNSLHIIEKYAQLDSRVRVINRNNYGQGATRNYGTNIANGKYIFFLDSDDYIEEKCIEKLVYKMEEENLEILMYNAVAFDDYDKCIKFHDNTYFSIDKSIRNKIMSGTEFANYAFYCISPCLKLYNKEFLINNNICFDEGRFGEDVLFWVKCLINAKKVMFIDYIGYYRRYRANSVMTSESTKVLEDRIKSLHDFEIVIRDLDQTQNIFKLNIANYSYSLLRTIFLYNNEDIKKLKRLFKTVNGDGIIYKYGNNKKLMTRILSNSIFVGKLYECYIKIKRK